MLFCPYFLFICSFTFFLFLDPVVFLPRLFFIILSLSSYLWCLHWQNWTKLNHGENSPVLLVMANLLKRSPFHYFSTSAQTFGSHDLNPTERRPFWTFRRCILTNSSQRVCTIFFNSWLNFAKFCMFFIIFPKFSLMWNSIDSVHNCGNFYSL